MPSLEDLINMTRSGNMTLLNLTQPGNVTSIEDQYNVATKPNGMTSFEDILTMPSDEDLLNLTQPGNVTSLKDLLNLTNLKNLEDILGNFKQTLTTSVDLSLSVFYSLVRNYFYIKIMTQGRNLQNVLGKFIRFFVTLGLKILRLFRLY